MAICTETQKSKIPYVGIIFIGYYTHVLVIKARYIVYQF
jgi:hypothetical protein